ncbi:MAG: exodeoxyribonuclease VII large subunit [Gammaproteobacteria bacterium]|nr:exodeoxyribonuclease VII large subunit [Gammaproteobacteria bacterium]
MPDTSQLQRDIFTVSRLNGEVRRVLEGSFPLLWVSGEISNLARPASGHIYFSLKDPGAQVRCAMFRMKRQKLRFEPENGSQVLVRARVGLYEGRGDFQLIIEHMEPAGEGALQQAFEALKAKLDAEGLFDSKNKRPLPLFPQQIGIITSPSGAAVSDVLTVLNRRFPGIPIVIYPTQVQGIEAPGNITRMIKLANKRNECDLLILTRGGGSLEDLMAFNNEEVARTIATAKIPLISAVGHEVDFTIADFVADRRAPTPSAAAELATPDRDELQATLTRVTQRLNFTGQNRIEQYNLHLEHLEKRLQQSHPGVALTRQHERLDTIRQQMELTMENHLVHRRQALQQLSQRMQHFTPAHLLFQLQQRCSDLGHRLNTTLFSTIGVYKQRFAQATGSLNALSPLATLERGYSISRRIGDNALLLNSNQILPGEQVETQLARGKLQCLVEAVITEEEPNQQ